MQSEKCLPPPVSIDHRQLLYELKKSVDLWFLSRRDCLDESMDDGERFFQVLLSIKNILTDGLYKKSDVEVMAAKCLFYVQYLTVITIRARRPLPTLSRSSIGSLHP